MTTAALRRPSDKAQRKALLPHHLRGPPPTNVAVGSQDATDEGGLGAGWRKLTVSQGISSPTARQAPRRSPRAAATREALPTASPPTPTTSATQGSGAALHVRSWRTLALLLLPTQLLGVRPRPGRGVHPEPRGHVLALGPPRPGRGVVGLGRVPTGPGVAFLPALGEPIHFPAADVIRRPLGNPCRRALRRPPLERGEMRLTRHAPPYGQHSPRRPVTGLAGHLALRAAARPREGPRGRAHDRAAQGVRAP